MIAYLSCSRLLTRAVAMTSLLVVAGHLAGCAGVGDSFASGAFVDPARYDLYDCMQLETERKKLAIRTTELQGLIDKAQAGAAGAVVGELAYRNDYISARAYAKLADQVWQKNKCVASPPEKQVPTATEPTAPRKRVH